MAAKSTALKPRGKTQFGWRVVWEGEVQTWVWKSHILLAKGGSLIRNEWGKIKTLLVHVANLVWNEWCARHKFNGENHNSIETSSSLTPAWLLKSAWCLGNQDGQAKSENLRTDCNFEGILQHTHIVPQSECLGKPSREVEERELRCLLKLLADYVTLQTEGEPPKRNPKG